MGGENEADPYSDETLSGSSPRGRGKPQERARSIRGIRLIPAWAGKTLRSPRGQPSGAAHPRVGGENSKIASGSGIMPGSSPRGRGKRQLDTVRVPAGGLIPAWAGKTDR